MACHKAADPGTALVVHSELSPLPAKIGPAAITLTLADASARPVTGAAIVLEADMSHPGMAPIFGGSTEVAPGRYSGNLAFSMAGDWVVLLHIKLADGTKIERQTEVKGVLAK